MFYRILFILILFIYIFSSYFKEIINNTDHDYMKNIQEEIYIDNKEVDVFDKKSLDEITITDKKVKAWIVQIYYNDNNQDMVKNILIKNGYNLKHNKKKSFFSIGPFAEMSHAKEESKKLKNVLGLDSKISSFIF